MLYYIIYRLPPLPPSSNTQWLDDLMDWRRMQQFFLALAHTGSPMRIGSGLGAWRLAAWMLLGLSFSMDFINFMWSCFDLCAFPGFQRPGIGPTRLDGSPGPKETLQSWDPTRTGWLNDSMLVTFNLGTGSWRPGSIQACSLDARKRFDFWWISFILCDLVRIIEDIRMDSWMLQIRHSPRWKHVLYHMLETLCCIMVYYNTLY